MLLLGEIAVVGGIQKQEQRSSVFDCNFVLAPTSRVTSRITRTPRRAGTPLRGARVLNVTRALKAKRSPSAALVNIIGRHLS